MLCRKKKERAAIRCGAHLEPPWLEAVYLANFHRLLGLPISSPVPPQQRQACFLAQSHPRYSPLTLLAIWGGSFLFLQRQLKGTVHAGFTSSPPASYWNRRLCGILLCTQDWGGGESDP